jgi:hypothetical protein
MARARRSGATAADDHEDHASDQDEAAHERRDEATFLGRDLDRTDADLLPVAYVGYALEGHHDPAEHDEHDSDDSDRFHVSSVPKRIRWTDA